MLCGATLDEVCLSGRLLRVDAEALGVSISSSKSRKRRAQPTAQWLTALGGAASANDPGSGHADLTSGRYDAITWAALALTAEKKHYQVTYNVT